MKTFALLAISLLLLFKYSFQYFEIGRRKKAIAIRLSWTVWLWTLCYILAIALALKKVFFQETISHSLYAGLILVFFGVVLRSAAILKLRNNYHESSAILQEQNLISTGVYSFIRHPLHLGLLLEVVGYTLIGLSFWSLFISAVTLAVLIIRNFIEEQDLITNFGKVYAEYIMQTWDIVDLFSEKTRQKVVNIFHK